MDVSPSHRLIGRAIRDPSHNNNFSATDHGISLRGGQKGAGIYPQTDVK